MSFIEKRKENIRKRRPPIENYAHARLHVRSREEKKPYQRKHRRSKRTK